jgi:hypothetical protein
MGRRERAEGMHREGISQKNRELLRSRGELPRIDAFKVWNKTKPEGIILRISACASLQATVRPMER